MTTPVPRSRYLTLGGREVHLTEWGDEAGDALVMWHGLARSGRDFDVAARHFAGRGVRVICPDTSGRGLSAWSDHPARDYTIAAYAAQAVEMLEQLGIGTLAWLGTSMGGLVGMVLAAGALAGRITRLVLNDIGPEINPAALQRIRTYATQPPVFDTMAGFEAYMRRVYAPFGHLPDPEWRHLAETSVRRRDDGRYTVHYDPRVMELIADPAAPPEPDRWPEWDAISCPTLVLRGAESDLLPLATTEEMGRRGPRPRVVAIAGCGHAPALNDPEQLAVLDGFLLGE